MIHPATELRFVSREIGYGVFALEPIPRGTVVWVLCRFDIIFSPAEIAALGEPYRPIVDRYAYRDRTGSYVLCWDAGRYVNHSCRPSMIGVGNQIEIATRDIAAGEELTCEYATLNITTAMICRCGAANCRSVIGSGDLQRLWPEFDRQMVESIGAARSVPQPLLPFSRDAQAFWNWVDSRSALPSHRDDCPVERLDGK